MSIDLGISWSNALWRGDWSLAPDGTLTTGRDIETAILISLFSDRTALPDDVLPDDGTIRGWWADTYRPYPIGSRLWLIWREKQTETTRLRAEEYQREALQWLIEIGVTASIDVACAWVERGFLETIITVETPRGDQMVYRYRRAWQ